MYNRRNKNTLVVILLLISSISVAQNYVEDALTYSQTKPGGSARIQAIGGAQISLGGDYSSALSNPAGLGMYNRSEFTFTPAISGYSSTSTYFGNTDKDGKTTLNIPGISLVIHGAKDKNGFLGGSFGVSMSRVNDFHGATTFHGTNPNNSIIDSYIDQANGYTTIQFDEKEGWQYNTPVGLAYFNYLIGAKSILDPPGPNDEYFTDAPIESNQRISILTKGATNQWSISYGGNYKDILFFGAGIGITSLKHKSQRIFDETFPDDQIINGHSLEENIQTKGTGFNATLGFILRPVNFLQIGASFTTPTLYSLTGSYDASMNSSWNDFDYFGSGKPADYLNEESASTDIVISEYSFRAPLKFSAGVAFISKFGFITGDIELSNPAQTKYTFNDQGQGYTMDFTQDNKDIKSLYKMALNYRIGAEYRYEIFRVRGGFGIQGNAYQKDLGLDNSIQNISGGVGVRTSSYYIDLALISSSQKKYSYQPYFPGDSFPDEEQPVATIKKNAFTGMVTVGFTF